MLIIQHFIVLRVLLKFYKWILQKLNSWVNLQPTLNIVCCFVDLFTSMIYMYPMKNRGLLAKKKKKKKTALFYEDIKNKRSGRMKLQTDQEFQVTNIKN